MSKTYNPRGFASLESVRSATTKKLKLRIRLPKAFFSGKSKYLNLGLDDTPKNRRYAERKIDAINADIVHECFDITLEKYKPQAKKTSNVTKFKTLDLPDIAKLYERYITANKNNVSPNTYCKNYLQWLKRLQNKDIPQECLEISEEGSLRLLAYLEKKYTSDANRRLIDQLNACCRWAIGAGIVALAVNPYEKLKKGMPKPKKKRKIPASFTKEEIKQIIEAFSNDKYYAHYTNYVAFLFATGARPSEAVCLTWDDIDSQFIYFNKRIVESENGRIVQEGLKSEDKRKFPINRAIQAILESQKAQNLSGELVFPSPKGKIIDIHNFCNRAWKKVLKELELKYKRPYTLRASFITHTLEHLDAKDIGRICGNLPETIYRHYASSNVSSLQVPEIF